MAAKRFASLLFGNSMRAVAVSAQRNARKFYSAGALLAATGGAMMGTAMIVAKDPIGLDDEEMKINIEEFMCQPITDMNTLEKSEEMMHKMELLCMQLQGQLCRELERIEGTTKFRVDRWLKCEPDKTKMNAIHDYEHKCQQKVWDSAAFPMLLERKAGNEELFEQIQGGGVTCIMEDGAVFERAGVNISVVGGKLRSEAVRAMNSQGRELPEDEEMEFRAVGISSVIHPRNPMVPTKHFNFRYFEVIPELSERQWWFGGGADLTPYYLDEKDVKHFHCSYKAACDLHGPSYYRRFKKWCDDYFFIKHRCMGRGVGGIFFDDFKSKNIDACFNFVKSCSKAVIPSYIPIVNKHKNDGYGLREREWQLTRRGHYTEFNLLYDRGTKFGFSTPGARHESILMSLPPRAAWHYCHNPEPSSKEGQLVEVLRNPKDWASV